MQAQARQMAGRTALVTGATSGIGLDLATCCAQGGLNLVLVARRAAELESVAEQLRSSYGRVVTPLVADLSETSSADHVADKLAQRGLAIDVLINNAGYAQYGAFADNDADAEMRMMLLNMVTLTRLTKRLLPPMQRQHWGKIMNVASTAAFMPGPLMTVYYATKAYVLSFSEALGEELRGSGVTVTALCPGPTQTGFQARAQMEDSKLVRGKQIMDAATVARSGYAAMMRGTPVVIPGMMNKIQALSPRFLPRRLMPAIVRRIQERAKG